MRAEQWAQDQVKRGKFSAPAVIGAVIDLGHCLNLTDSRYIELLENEYKLLAAEAKAKGVDLPRNAGSTRDEALRRLDCAVIEHLHAFIDEQPKEERYEPFDSVRGLFSEGDPICESASFKRGTHVQLCIRNPNCIKAYFPT